VTDTAYNDILTKFEQANCAC